MTEESDIQIRGMDAELTADEIRAMAGAIVHVPVGCDMPPEGIGYYDMFRFAHVLSVSTRTGERSQRCPICEAEHPRFSLEIEWEAEYESDLGNVLCERCVDGVVTSGHDRIAFDDSRPQTGEFSISTTYGSIGFDLEDVNGMVISGVRRRERSIGRGSSFFSRSVQTIRDTLVGRRPDRE